ncbi:unnamed protein product [Paramecium octaurelia]|uniref:Uncharacterized protein n=1 Tax=Paramecium octaurelia TaxID=43137 RepID=A0A8S1YJS5_PAROT|nr:unnamed protein product [Paramecium octaurelia]
MQHQYHYNYQLIPGFSFEQRRHSTVLAINKSNTMVYSAGDNKIVVFQLKNGLRQLQQVKSHSIKITTLNVFNQNSGLVSGSLDASIVLWSLVMNRDFKYLARLKEHKNEVTCLVLHPFQSNLIISGSDDQSIKFWTFNCLQFSNKKSWYCSQTISQHNSTVSQISISQDGNKLISCSNKLIIVISYSVQNLWQVNQLIQLSEVGVRLSFINDNLFAYQPWTGKSLHIYKLDSIENQYVKSKEVAVQGQKDACWSYFPAIYAPSKNILICKNGYKINVLKFIFSSSDSDWQCHLEQSINYKHNWVFGTLSADGQYLITSDWFSKSIQIRQLTYQENIEQQVENNISNYL